MNANRWIAPALASWLVFAGQPAAADAPCDKGFRDTTAGERARMTAILETVRKALPPAPQGWVILGDDAISVPQSLCMDYERAPWGYGFSREYQRVDNQAERDAAVAAAGKLWQEDQARKQPRIDAITQKIEPLIQQQVALLQKGDLTRAAALSEQIAALQDEQKRIMDEGDVQARTDALIAAANRDTSIYVTVNVNPWYAQPPPDGAQALALPAGARWAHRWRNGGQPPPSDTALFVYGQWRPRGGGGFNLVARGSIPSNLVHAMTVQVTADPGRLNSLLGAIDMGSFGRLVPP